MELIEQDFLEAMFDELLREEDEKESYYGPPDELPQLSFPQTYKSDITMQLPKVRGHQYTLYFWYWADLPVCQIRWQT